jgi:hypothetical protein
MRHTLSILLPVLLTTASFGASAATSVPQASGKEPVPALPSMTDEQSAKADKRYEEMLDRMQAAIEEVAQLYGNPAFLQVFTNDSIRADQLRQRLKDSQTSEDVRLETVALQKKRDDLVGSVALLERESSKLAARLVRQRAALDALASAVEQAKKAVEDTSR